MQASWIPPFPGLPVSDMWFQEKPLSGFALVSWPVKLSTDFTGSVELLSEILVSLSTEQMCSDQECDYQQPAPSRLLCSQSPDEATEGTGVEDSRHPQMRSPGGPWRSFSRNALQWSSQGSRRAKCRSCNHQPREKEMFCFVRQLLYFIGLNYITPFCVSQRWTFFERIPPPPPVPCYFPLPFPSGSLLCSPRQLPFHLHVVCTIG